MKQVTILMPELDWISEYFEIMEGEAQSGDREAQIFCDIAEKAKNLNVNFSKEELKVIAREAKFCAGLFPIDQKFYQRIAEKTDLALSESCIFSLHQKKKLPPASKSVNTRNERVEFIKHILEAVMGSGEFVTLIAGEEKSQEDIEIDLHGCRCSVPYFDVGERERLIEFIRCSFEEGGLKHIPKKGEIGEKGVVEFPICENVEKEADVIEKLYVRVFRLPADYWLTRLQTEAECE